MARSRYEYSTSPRKLEPEYKPQQKQNKKSREDFSSELLSLFLFCPFPRALPLLLVLSPFFLYNKRYENLKLRKENFLCPILH